MKFSGNPHLAYPRTDMLNYLSIESAADCFHIRSIAEERFIRKIGRVSLTIREEIKEALSKVLTMNPVRY